MVSNNEDESFTDSKKDVLKFLKIIGVDSRFVSYTPSKIYRRKQSLGGKK